MAKKIRSELSSFNTVTGGGWLVAGWLVGYSDIKANSVQLQLQLPTGTELGNMFMK